MKKNLLRLISVFSLCILLASLVCPMASFATMDPDTNEYVDWKLSGDGMTVTDGEKTYTRYRLPLDVFLDPAHEYVYDNVLRDGTSLSSTEPGGQIVWGDINSVFVTEQGKEMLDRYAQKDEGIIRLLVEQSSKEAALDEQSLALLQALTEKRGMTVSVQGLDENLVYRLYLYDENDIFCKEYGGIYRIGSKLYYVNYRTLDNNSFDSEGRFSYRSGNVTLYPLDSAAKKAVTAAENNARARKYETVWENDTWSDRVMETDFPLAYAIWGFILPAAFLVLGIVLPMRKRGKHWRILIPLSGVWMLLAIALLIVIL